MSFATSSAAMMMCGFVALLVALVAFVPSGCCYCVINNTRGMDVVMTCFAGGGKKRSVKFTVADLTGFPVIHGSTVDLCREDIVTFKRPFNRREALSRNEIVVDVPLYFLATYLTGSYLLDIGKEHRLKLYARSSVNQIAHAMLSHSCDSYCDRVFSVFQRPAKSRVNLWHAGAYTIEGLEHSSVSFTPEHAVFLQAQAGKNDVHTTSPLVGDMPTETDLKKDILFPPKVHSRTELVELIREYCDAISLSELGKKPCGCCGHSVKQKEIRNVHYNDPMLRKLSISGVRAHEEDDTTPVLCNAGVVSQKGGRYVQLCLECFNALYHKRLPLLALANGLWLGDIPPELQELNTVEKLLVA